LPGHTGPAMAARGRSQELGRLADLDVVDSGRPTVERPILLMHTASGSMGGPLSSLFQTLGVHLQNDSRGSTFPIWFLRRKNAPAAPERLGLCVDRVCDNHHPPMMSSRRHIA